MGESLLSGSALAAFLAGTVAFFAPCCAFVMLPTYLASVAGASRWRTAALTAIFVGGVATIVLPLTVGAAGLSQVIAANHETMFVVGGVLMLAVGAATLSGWMWHHAPALGGGDPSGAAGIYFMGVFAGAATACCAPVLAGAVAIAGISGSWWAGAVLGVFYLLGLVSPLLLSSLGIGRLRRRVRDPAVNLSVAGRRLQTTVTRLAGGLMFLGLGLLLIVLAVTGNARDAPAFQRTFGRWLTDLATDATRAVPTAVGWLIVLGVLAAALFFGVRSLRRPGSLERAVDADPDRPSCCDHTRREEADLEGVAS